MDCLQLPDPELGIEVFFRDDIPFSCPMHRHAYHEMVYIFSGTGYHVTEQGKYAIGTGDIFVIRPEAAHGYSNRTGMSLINIMFDLKKIPFSETYLRKNPIFHAFFETTPTLSDDFRFHNKLTLFDEDRSLCEKIMHDLIFERKNRMSCWESKICVQLTELIIQIVRACSGGRQRGLSGRVMVLDRIIEFMKKNRKKKITIPTIAEGCGVTQKTMERLFLDAMQTTPLAFLNFLRLQDAEKLLLETNDSISEIAFLTGFSDSNYFSKIFYKKHLITPRAFRMKETGTEFCQKP